MMKTQAFFRSSLAATLVLLIFSGCAVSTEREELQSEEGVDTVAAISNPPSPAEQIKAGIDLQTEADKAKAVAAQADTAAVKAVSVGGAAKHSKIEGVDPEKALGWLKNGNVRFVRAKLRNDGQATADIERLAKGQKPHTIVLSCSDSRVPPEIVFDQKLGEIFVVRTAGQSLESNAIGSIEYAIEHLGAKLIVVMGHTSCGAVKAALGTLGGGDAGSPSLNRLVADIHPRIQQFKAMTPSSSLERESWANTYGVAKDLLTRSALISSAVQSGEVKVVTAMYFLENGKVEFK